MTFYSGFSLQNDKFFFKNYLKDSDYNVAGFSYGAIKAFYDVKNRVNNYKRVDTLQLFSPAFFQTKPLKFKKLQTIAYSKDSNSYLKNFIKNSFLPFEQKELKHTDTTKDELYELLYFQWSSSELLELKNKGVKIEVYLGSEDKIIDANSAKEFFLDVADVTYINGANHFLQLKEDIYE
jgi:hypothetical protein